MAISLHDSYPNLGHKDLVFASVFSIPSINYTTPTPIATPDLGSTAFGQAFGGFSSQAAPKSSGNLAAQQVKRNIAWSTATRFLRLPRPEEGERHNKQTRSSDVTEALQYLLVGDGAQDDWEDISGGSEGIIAWYLNDVRSHFLEHADPYLRRIWDNAIKCSKAWEAIEETIRLLEQAQSLYLLPMVDHIFPILRNAESRVPGRAAFLESKVRRELHAVFTHQLPAARFSKTLSYVLYDAGCQLFRLHIQSSSDSTQSNDFRKSTLALLTGLKEVGIGQSFAQRSFGHAMDKLMGDFIVSHYLKVDWYGRKPVISKLRQWIVEGFAPFVRMVLDTLSENENAEVGSPAEIQHWQDMAIGRLGRARVDNLFDYIVNWDRSLGAILDLKEYITNNADRAYLIVSFIGQLHRRLLRAGTTTTHILDVYIYVIRAFQELEPRGVLLNRVAQPIRQYLRDRSDTARVIVSSLLADTKDEKGNKIDPAGTISIEIAAEMQKPFSNSNDYDEDLNWNDMNWTPEPQDAGPDYRSSKNDVISYLLTLYDREEFITELKNILGEHLLKNKDSEFEKERRLLELFKIRLGDDKLQACEVMLKDVEESKRMDSLIHKSQQQELSAPSLPELSTQILSSYFWPPLRDDEFTVPASVQTAQSHYSKGFESIKDMRKLRWFPAIGTATVELQLEDRTISRECGTWQASIIYAFQPQPGEPVRVGGVMRTMEQLEEMLEMNEDLIRNGLNFWVAERVLAPHSSIADAFTVLERLPSSTSSSSAADAAAEAAKAEQKVRPGIVSSESLLDKNKELYEQFVVGMLTNQGNMPKMRILMMLKMAVPGGFPGGGEELGELLEELKAKGSVTTGGGDVWGIKK